MEAMEVDIGWNLQKDLVEGSPELEPWDGVDIDLSGINLNWDREMGLPDLRVEECLSSEDEDDAISANEEELRPTQQIANERLPGLKMNKKMFALLPPETPLSKYIQEHVDRIMVNTRRPVFVRIVSNVSQIHELCEPVKEFMKENGVAGEFPYKSKLLMCFQARSNGFVAFFAAYFQEYGDNCPMPNRNMSYLSYMDSVNLFRPLNKKRFVIYAVLLSYMNYIRHFGFERLFLWCCPPPDGVEYVFRNRPETQKSHQDAGRLLKWYGELEKFAVRLKILSSASNLQTFSGKKKKQSGDRTLLKHIPLCNGDHWPTTIENAIKSFNPNVPAPPPSPPKCKRRGKKKGKKIYTDVQSHVKAEIKNQLGTVANAFRCFNFIKEKLSPEMPYEPEETPPSFLDSRDKLTDFFKKKNLHFRDVQNAKAATKAILLEKLRETKTTQVQMDGSGLERMQLRARR